VNNEPIYNVSEGSVDLVLSNLWLHWVNDLPGYLTQIRRSLRPDGAFIGAILGGSTLQELRSAFAVADMERKGGVTPHVSPFAGPRDVGDLLGRAGFTLPTSTRRLSLDCMYVATLTSSLCSCIV
jgi:NADH dehydrogenase [ubiquinone] 1 alpha subcomplex assembly factor 5